MPSPLSWKSTNSDSSRALARFAVLSRWSRVREAAGKLLQSRPLDPYVPLLLSELSTPVESRIQAARINGRMLYRHVLERDVQDRRQVVVLDTVQVRRPRLLVSGTVSNGEPETRARAMRNMRNELALREQQRVQQNQWILDLNERIGEALAFATGQNLPPASEAWWSWWNEYNDVVREGEKFTDIRYNRDIPRASVTGFACSL